jgi:hypothetical protein
MGRIVRPGRVRRDPDGGAFFEYTLGEATVTAAEAPPSLDLTTASEEVLARYGLPPRPAEAEMPAWLAAMRAYRSAADRDHSLCLGDGLGGGSRRALIEAQCTAGPNFCTNYAGRTATLGGYTAISANVTVPSMSVSGNCASEGHISSWVGIGTAIGEYGLLQAGTITRLYPGLAIYTYAFYEWYSSQGGPWNYPVLSAWNAAPGHQMYERVFVNTSSHGVNFYVEDVTTGQHLTATVGGIYADYSPGSAGWITENHTDGDEPNVKTAPWNWTNALVTRYSTTTYGGSTQSTTADYGVELGPPPATGNEIVEQPSAWTSTTSFPTSWVACRG